MLTGVHVVHISIYAFLPHKAKILLLQVTCVRKRNHNRVEHLPDKAQLSYKKHAMSFSLPHNTIKEKIVSLVTVPSPILPTLSLNNLSTAIFFSTDLVPSTGSDFVLGFLMLFPWSLVFSTHHLPIPGMVIRWQGDTSSASVKPLCQPKDRILGSRGSQAFSCFYNAFLTFTMNKISQTFSKVSSSPQ